MLDGKQICAALDTKPGVWTKSALDVVMAWQLRNPDVTDTKDVLEEVRAWKEQVNIEEPPKKKAKKQGELTSDLTSHFLRLTLRPLFSQASSDQKLTPAGRKNINADLKQTDHNNLFNEDIRPWKNKDIWSLDLLHWICKNLDQDCVQREWGFLVPPILTVLDDTQVEIRTRGCILVQSLLQKASTKLLTQTGLTPVFEESLLACTTYLPSLTPESDSIAILNVAYPALLTLADTAFPVPSSPAHFPARTKFVMGILRKGFLAGFAHSGSNVHIAPTLLSHLPPILSALGIDSVVHLKDLVPMLSNILADPFAPASPELVSTALKAYKAVISNAWPRIWFWRGEILRGVCTLWLRILEEECMSTDTAEQDFEEKPPKRQIAPRKEQVELAVELEGVQAQLKDIVYGLDRAVLANKDPEENLREVWPRELVDLMEADDELTELFAELY